MASSSRPERASGDQAVPFEGYRTRVAEADVADTLSRRGAVLIEGVRWCGKTSTALRFAASALRLDDPDALTLAEADSGEALSGDTPRLIDEWQNAPRLWNRIRRECDDRARPGQFILTGSASPTSDITRHTGTGRIARVKLRPMSLFETGASDGSVPLAGLLDGNTYTRAARDEIGLRQITEWICGGGWPANLAAPTVESARRSARDQLRESVQLDLPAAAGVRHDREAVMTLARSLARNVASEARVSTLAADVSSAEQGMDSGAAAASRQTLTHYLAALRRIFLIEDQPAWGVHLQSKAALRKAPKRHFVDPSLAAAALDATPRRLLAEPKTLGLLFESLVVRDLRIYSQPLQGAVYHYRDSDDLEVDAIVSCDDGRWLAVEIKLSHSPETIDAAARSLHRLRDKIAPDRQADLAGLVVVTARGPRTPPPRRSTCGTSHIARPLTPGLARRWAQRDFRYLQGWPSCAIVRHSVTNAKFRVMI